MEHFYQKWLIGNNEKIIHLINNESTNFEHKWITLHLKQEKSLLTGIMEQLYATFSMETPSFLKELSRSTLNLIKGSLKSIDLLTGLLADSMINALIEHTELNYSEKEQKAKIILLEFDKLITNLNKGKEKLDLDLTLSLIKKISEIYPIVIEIKDLYKMHPQDINLIKYLLNDRLKIQVIIYTNELNFDNNSVLKNEEYYLQRYDKLVRLGHYEPPSFSIKSYFIGRQELVESILRDAENVHLRKKTIIRGISGNAGLGKTTLLQHIENNHKIEGQKIVYTPFLNEVSTSLERLHEIKQFINHLKLCIQTEEKSKIVKLIQNTKEMTKENLDYINQLVDKYPNARGVFEEVITGLLEEYDYIGKAKKVQEIYYDLKAVAEHSHKQQSKFTISKHINIDYILIEDEVELLLSQTHDLLIKAKEYNKSFIWILDDIQWADQFILSFVNQLLEKLKDEPIYVIIASRVSDSESKATYDKGLAKLINHIHFVELEMFTKNDIIEFIKKTFHNPSTSLINMVSDSMCQYLFNGQRDEIEPIFVAELIYLLFEECEKSFEITDNGQLKLQIEGNSFQLQLQLFINNLIEKNKLFEKHTYAIFAERLVKITSHLNQGKSYVEVLKNYSFIGEPIIPDLFSYCLQQNYELSLKVEEFDKLEKIHQVILLIQLIDSDALYNFKHALYKDFLKDCYLKENNVSELILHHQAYKQILNYKQNTQNINNSNKKHINNFIIKHGLNSNEKDIHLIETIHEQVKIYIDSYQFEEALLLNYRLGKLLVHSEPTDSVYLAYMSNQLLLHNGLGYYKTAQRLSTDLLDKIASNFSDLFESNMELLEELLQQVSDVFINSYDVNSYQAINDLWGHLSVKFDSPYYDLLRLENLIKVTIQSRNFNEAIVLLKQVEKIIITVEEPYQKLSMMEKMMKELKALYDLYKTGTLPEHMLLEGNTPTGIINNLSLKISATKWNKQLSVNQKVANYEEYYFDLLLYDEKNYPRTTLRYRVGNDLADGYYKLYLNGGRDMHFLNRSISIAEATFNGMLKVKEFPSKSLEQIKINLLQYYRWSNDIEKAELLFGKLNLKYLNQTKTFCYWNLQAIHILKSSENRFEALKILLKIILDNDPIEEGSIGEIVQMYNLVKQYNLKPFMNKSQIKNYEKKIYQSGMLMHD